MINILKRWAIGAADAVHDALDPYSDFTRQFMSPPDNLPLSAKATFLLDQLLTTFKLPNGLFLYNRAKDGEVPDYGDQALHHGLGLAALSFGHAVEEVEMGDVCEATRAVRLLFENEELIRGRDPRDNGAFADNASNDSATGVLCGLYFAAKYGKVYTSLRRQNMKVDSAPVDFVAVGVV